MKILNKKKKSKQMRLLKIFPTQQQTNRKLSNIATDFQTEQIRENFIKRRTQ